MPSLEQISRTGPERKQQRTAATTVIPHDQTSASADSVVLKVVPDVPIEIPLQKTAEEPAPQEIPLPPIAKPVVQRSHREICDTLTESAHLNQLPIPFFIRLLFQESRFRPEAVSRAGAQGIAQFMPETAANVGLDNPFDPLPAIRASARLLRELAQQFGNLGLAAAAYNAGPKRISDWLARKGKLPEETQGYVKTITGRRAETWMVAETGTPALKLPRQAPCQQAAGLLAWNGPERIPFPPAHKDVVPAARETLGARMIAQRARVKVARHEPLKVATIAKSGSPTEKPGKPSASRANPRKEPRGAVQLAASGKKGQRKLRLSQR